MVPGVATAGGTYQYRTHIRGGQAEINIPGKQRAAEELLVLSCTKQFPISPNSLSGLRAFVGVCKLQFPLFSLAMFLELHCLPGEEAVSAMPKL